MLRYAERGASQRGRAGVERKGGKKDKAYRAVVAVVSKGLKVTSTRDKVLKRALAFRPAARERTNCPILEQE